MDNEYLYEINRLDSNISLLLTESLSYIKSIDLMSKNSKLRRCDELTLNTFDVAYDFSESQLLVSYVVFLMNHVLKLSPQLYRLRLNYNYVEEEFNFSVYIRNNETSEYMGIINLRNNSEDLCVFRLIALNEGCLTDNAIKESPKMVLDNLDGYFYILEILSIFKKYDRNMHAIFVGAKNNDHHDLITTHQNGFVGLEDYFLDGLSLLENKLILYSIYSDIHGFFSTSSLSEYMAETFYSSKCAKILNEKILLELMEWRLLGLDKADLLTKKNNKKV